MHKTPRTRLLSLFLLAILSSFCGPGSVPEGADPAPNGPGLDPWWGPSAPPQVDAVSPLRGSNCGGSLLVVEGKHFTSQTTVHIGGAVAPGVNVLSGTRLTARVPAQRTVLGPAPVRVQNPDGSSVQFDQPFVYDDCVLGFPNRSIKGAIPVVADFNQDGRLDFVTAGPGVALNEGKLDFAATRRIASGFSFSFVEVADFNRDQKPDLAFACQDDGSGSRKLRVALGDGAGGFGAPTTTVLSSGTVYKLVVGDWNGDGFPDVATGHARELWVFLGDGMGGFGPPSITPITVSNNYDIAVGDWNKDGKDDLAYCRGGERDVIVRLSTGTGALGPEAKFDSGTYSVRRLLALDADGDGDLDLVISSENAGAFLVRGDGRGAFAAAGSLTPMGFLAGRATVADVNKDQKPDLIINGTMPSSTHSTWILFGNEGGSFSGFIGYPVGVNSLDIRLAPRIADFDGDSNLDLITDSGISLGDGTGYFYTPTALGTISDQTVTGLINQDPYPDLVGDLGAKVLLGNGKGGIALISYGTSFPASAIGSPVLADLDGDYNQDLIALYSLYGSSSVPARYRVGIKYGFGDGGFSDAVDFGISTTAIGRLDVGDFDKDQRSDLAILDRESQRVILVMGSIRGDLTKRTVVDLSGADNNQLIAGDFNSDNRLDIAVCQSDLVAGQPGAIAILWGDGLGGFPTITRHPVRGNPSSIAAGDVNRDGRLDLVYVDTTNAGLLLGDGAGNFASETSFATEPGACIRLADLNGDQRLDLVSGSPSLTVQLGDGAGNFERPRSYGAASCSLNIGDFNGDLQPDVVIGNLLFSGPSPFQH